MKRTTRAQRTAANKAWKASREALQARIAALGTRDGDCESCGCGPFKLLPHTLQDLRDIAFDDAWEPDDIGDIMDDPSRILFICADCYCPK